MAEANATTSRLVAELVPTASQEPQPNLAAALGPAWLTGCRDGSGADQKGIEGVPAEVAEASKPDGGDAQPEGGAAQQEPGAGGVDGRVRLRVSKGKQPAALGRHAGAAGAAY